MPTSSEGQEPHLVFLSRASFMSRIASTSLCWYYIARDLLVPTSPIVVSIEFSSVQASGRTPPRSEFVSAKHDKNRVLAVVFNPVGELGGRSLMERLCVLACLAQPKRTPLRLLGRAMHYDPKIAEEVARLLLDNNPTSRCIFFVCHLNPEILVVIASSVAAASAPL